MYLNANNISFAYKKNKPILQNISISIPENKVIGLIVVVEKVRSVKLWLVILKITLEQSLLIMN